MNRIQFLISAGLFVGAVGLASVATRPAVESVQYYSSCPTGAERIDVDVDSSFDLVDGAIARSSAFRDESIRHHVAFLKTHLKEQVEAKGANIAFTDVEPEILWSQESETRWSQTTRVLPVAHKDVELTSEYLRSQIGHVLTDQTAARSVRYRARFGVWLCGDGAASEWELTGPRDPWLAHWLSEKTYKVKWRSSEFLVPAFVDDEYADIPHPEYTWYFWKPETPRAQRETRAFTTARAVIAKRTAIPSIERYRFQILPSAGRVAATVIFGIIDPKQNPWALNELEPKAGTRHEWSQVVASLSAWSDWSHGDRGSNYAFRFLESMPGLFASDFRFEILEDKMIVEGSLKESGKPFTLKFYFGPTDVLAGEPPRHWDLAREGLLQDDLIFYVGHSGLGQNFAWSNMNARAPASSVPDRHRLIGVFSCYSADYFEQDLTRFMTKSSVLVLTGSNYTSARGPLGMIEWSDKILAHGAYRQQPPRIEPNDFLIFKTTQ